MFERISIGIRTFLRDEKLYKTLSDIRRTMPEIRIIVADDGEQTEEKDSIYAELIREGHKVIICDFDSGFGHKSNRITAALDTEFLLISADDFDHAPSFVRLGIEKMLEVLIQQPELSIASGRLANRGPYEFYLREQDNMIEEVPIPDFYWQTGWLYQPADVTVNYSMIRRETFEKVHFDEEEIIGEGGHGAFFYDVKKAGLKVGWIPGVEISEQTGEDSPRYRQYRARASGPSRKCFQKRGIRKWTLGNGQVDFDMTKEGL